MKTITKKWLEFALEDLKLARLSFEKKYRRGASWHCHQSIEKMLKAIAVEQKERAAKTHDLVKLYEDSGAKLPKDLEIFLEELNLLYLPPRYPDLYEEMKKAYRASNIKRVIGLTEILFKWLKNQLNQSK